MEFRFEERPGHVLAIATGPYDAATCRAAVQEVVRIAMASQLKAILVDARAITELVPIADRFDLAKLLAASNPPLIAVLVTPANAEYTRTFQDTAVQGGALVRTTSDEREARRFLGIA